MDLDFPQEWPWVSRERYLTRDEMVAERQVRMNRPEVRDRAYSVLEELSECPDGKALGILRKRIQEGAEDGIALELAALIILKPDAPRGEECSA